MNAVSTVFSVDFYRSRLVKGRDDLHYLFAARCFTIGAGILMIIGALIFNMVPKESMLDTGNIVISVFGGAIFALFMVGFFTRRGNQKSVLFSLGITTMVTIYLSLGSFGIIPEGFRLPIHVYWVGIFTNFVFIMLVFPLDFIFHRKGEADLRNLTVWTRKK
jgi:SSS family solute:Na+ symporter